MSLGRRDDEKQQLRIATYKIARPTGHPFYAALNHRLARAGFDPLGRGALQALLRREAHEAVYGEDMGGRRA